MADDNRSRGAGDAFHAMMFGHSVSREAKVFRVRRKVSGVGQGGADAAAFNDGYKIEDRKRGHR